MKWLIGLFLIPALMTMILAQDAPKLSPDASKAYDALVAFATAPTWETAAKHVLDREKLRGRMEEHYAGITWKPLAILRSQHRGAIAIDGPSKYNTHNFELIVSTLSVPLSMSVIEVGDEYLVDWELFAQFHDRSFERFLSSKAPKPQTFRLNLVKGITLNEDKNLPLLGEPLRLRAAWYPSMGYPGNVYVGLESDVGKKAKDLVGWNDGKPFRATVKLTKAEKGNFVEVVELELIDLSTPSVFSD